MTVRWRPLIVLSGLFLVIAVGGLLAVTLDVFPGSASDILPKARQEWRDGRYSNAQIHFQRALQLDPKNAALHAELATMCAEWASKEADPGTRARLRAERLSALANAARYGKDPAPLRELLAEALAGEDGAQAELWAKKLLDLDSDDPDAHFALAVEALTDSPLDIEAAKRHLEALEEREPHRVRTSWIKVRLAQQGDEPEAVDTLLHFLLNEGLPAGDDATDRLARLHILQIGALATNDPATLLERAGELAIEARGQLDDLETLPIRAASIARLLESLQRHLALAVVQHPEQADTLNEAGDALETVVEAGFRTALDATGSADLILARHYAEHLLFREERARCLELIQSTLDQPAATLPQWAETVTRLRELAIKASLLDSADPQRIARAEPHIKALMNGTNPAHQAVGHLFQGVLELERSGVAEAATGAVDENGASVLDPAGRSRLRDSALEHLKIAAAGMPEVSTAQALYGVALTLTGEPALGRQYLTAARRLPNLEPRYQVWSAWAMIQAGYPEEAEPIVADLKAVAEAGSLPADLAPTLHLLTAEILQSRRTPDDLARAVESYEAALAAGQPDTPSLQLRLAQIDVMRGKPQEGLNRIQKLRELRAGGPMAEHLAVLILNDAGKTEQARAHLDSARKVYPDSTDLVGLDAALWIGQKQPEKADSVLAEFLETHPEDATVIPMRARVLSESLGRPDDARALLAAAAERADSSGPLVQLALLDLSRKDFDAVAASIIKIRDRWKEAAAADLLDAQLALAKQNPSAALEHLQDALRKDPSNKLALFWKAQLDDRSGSTDEAARIYESILKANPVKELDDGLSLATAAQWALANHALENRQLDTAISRLEDLLRGGVSGEMTRPVRWQLAAARSSSGQWPAARAEIVALLKDPVTTGAASVRAANLFRLNGETANAVKLLDAVLKTDPGDSGAVAIRAYLLAETEPAQAVALIRTAIAAGEQPASIHLMLAALENMSPPTETGLDRALGAIDDALKQYPDSIELVQARYRVLSLSGKPDDALAYLEAQAENDPRGDFQRLLADTHRDAGRYEAAERVIRDLLETHPTDATLAATLVQMVALRSAEAARTGDTAAEGRLNEETGALIERFREQFPNDLNFPRAECELAARTGQLDRAVAITREIDASHENSPVGPALRAQIAAVRGFSEGMAQEYAEAVHRAPNRADLRLALGEAELALGRTDEALVQADWLLEQNAANSSAIVLKARALSQSRGTPNQVQARRDEAVRLLTQTLATRPDFATAYHMIAEIRAMGGDRAGAIDMLKRGLQAIRNDSVGMAQLTQILTQPGPNGQPPSDADIREATAWANQHAEPDATGDMALSASIGFHRAGQFELAFPWAEKAVERLGSWVAHLNHADLLMARAETTDDSSQARALFEQALAAYDRVLVANASSIEAINNKAWILHEHLGRHAEALAVVESLMSRVDPAILPPDFFDTLGSIQEGMNRSQAAEDAYAEGLRRAGDHPILNYHMGRLLLSDESRATSAVTYLKKAQDARGALPPAMAADIETLLRGSAN